MMRMTLLTILNQKSRNRRTLLMMKIGDLKITAIPKSQGIPFHFQRAMTTAKFKKLLLF